MKGIINSAPSYIHQSESLEAAVEKMAQHRNSSFLVHDDRNCLVGILTRCDILLQLAQKEWERVKERLVGELMSSPVECVSYDNLVAEIHYLMTEYHLKHFPVVRKQGIPSVANIVGIVHLTDIASELFIQYFKEKNNGLVS